MLTMNGCVSRWNCGVANKDVPVIKNSRIPGLTNVPPSKTADAIIEALNRSVESIKADMFLEEEDDWPDNVRRRWKSFKNKLEWNDLMETIAKRSSGGLYGGPTVLGGGTPWA